MSLENLYGVPPSYYFIATLKEGFVRELVGRMAVRTAADAGADAASPPPEIPPSAKEALEWAVAQAARGGGAVSRAAFEAEARLAATTVAGVFTSQLAASKKLQPFAECCRLLCDVPAGGIYEEGRWRPDPTQDALPTPCTLSSAHC